LFYFVVLVVVLNLRHFKMRYDSQVSQDTENFIIKIRDVNVSEEEISVIPKEKGIEVKISDENLRFNSPKIDMENIISDLKDKILTVKANILKEKQETQKPKELTDKIGMFQKEINDRNKEIANLKNKYEACLRQLADFDNARKIWDNKEKEIKKYGAKDFMLNLLPLLDTYNAAFASYKDKNLSVESMELFEGMKKIYERLICVLKEQGLGEISSMGKIFAPYKHEGLMQEETDKFPDGTIIKEFQKGYIYKDMLLRSSKVKVAKAKSNDNDNNNNNKIN